MKRVLLGIATVVALLPAVVLAQGNDSEDEADGLLLRINGTVSLPEDDTVNAAVAINSDITVLGTVRDVLFVINADAVVNGTVEGEITIVNGTLTLGPQATVNDISLVRSELVEEPGSTITGDVDRTTRWVFWSTGAAILFGIAFWLAMTISLVLAGLLFAAIGGRQLKLASALMTGAPGPSILSGVIASIALPLVAVVAIATLIGIPFGLGILLVLIPAIVFLGYIVSANWFGTLLLNRAMPDNGSVHPYAQVTVGIILLQFLLLIPGVAPVVFLVAGIWGGGALIWLAWSNVRNRPADVATPVAQPPAPPAAPAS
jgi:hypothetical protein